jgi:hypothetical protein
LAWESFRDNKICFAFVAAVRRRLAGAAIWHIGLGKSTVAGEGTGDANFR